MYKINTHFTESQKRRGICKEKDLKYLNAEKLRIETNGFYCKKWGDDYIIETTIGDAEVITKLIITAVSYITMFKKPFVIYY